MKGFFKICLIVAFSLIALGIVLLAVGVSLNGGIEMNKYVTKTYDNLEEFKDIYINADTADINFLKSTDNKAKVVCYEQEKEWYNVVVQGGKLSIEVQSNKKWYDYIGISFKTPKITVYLPNFEYGAVSVKVSTGSVVLNKEFTFSIFNDFSYMGIAEAIKNCNVENKQPVFICIGSDLILGDSLGPLIGTKIKEAKLPVYFYGSLGFPITAKEISYVKDYIKEIHPNSFIVAIDAAVGDDNDVGLIKVSDKGIMPGLGVKKKLGKVGDCGIMGIIAKRSTNNVELFNLTRLNLVYKASDIIINGIKEYLNYLKNNEIFKKAQ